MQDARSVANFLLENFDSASNEITNLKINKIVYFLHGWHLVRKNSPLIRNHIEAWQHGPVIKVIYEAFKRYGNKIIIEPAKFFSYSTGNIEVVSFDDSFDIDKEFLLKVANYYMKFSASDLRALTHKVGGPWDQIFHLPESERGINARVPNELIYEHFVLLTESRRTH